MQRTRSLPARAIAGVGALIVAVTVAACGSGGSQHSANTIPRAPGGGSQPAAAPANEQASIATALACVRQHGANIPDPQIDANGQVHFDQAGIAAVPQAVAQAAEHACADLIAKAVASVPKDPNLVADRVKFAQCMRQHGVPDFPDPDPTTGQFSGANQAALKSSPQFSAAQQACQNLLPNGNGVG